MLVRLFADQQAAFRHRMGVSRTSVHDFYQSTAQAEAIRAEKEAILRSFGADRYLVETSEGRPAFDEFVRLLGGRNGAMEVGSDETEYHRAITLALEPDWLLLAPPDWRLVWASVCFPTRWSLVGKARLPLPDIHGSVPGLNEELARKIDVFFDRLTFTEGWARANWGLSTSAERNQHPSLPYTPLTSQTPVKTVFVRLESQCFVKLPVTGSVAFGIRILNFSLAEVMERPAIAAGLKEQLRTMPGEVAAYKGIPADFWRRV